MLNDTAKNMQIIICQAIDSGNYYAAYEALIIYTQTFQWMILLRNINGL